MPRHRRHHGPPEGPELDDEHGPPHHHEHGPPHHHAAYSTVDAFIDPEAIDHLLAPWIPAAPDRAFVVRCITGEGPVHHRGASFVLLSLLGRALAAAGGAPEPDASGELAPVPLRLPPHLAEHSKGDPNYPLGIPLAPLRALADGDRGSADAMADCLADGPSHHALANVAMVCLIEALLRRLDAREP